MMFFSRNSVRAVDGYTPSKKYEIVLAIMIKAPTFKAVRKPIVLIHMLILPIISKLDVIS